MRPRIRVPDSATNTDLETISESDLVDDVEMNGEGGFWTGGRKKPLAQAVSDTDGEQSKLNRLT